MSVNNRNRYPQFPLRMDPNIIKKLRVIAAENCRSASKEIDLLIRNYVRDYEATYGEITQDEIDRVLNQD